MKFDTNAHLVAIFSAKKCTMAVSIRLNDKVRTKTGKAEDVCGSFYVTSAENTSQSGEVEEGDLAVEISTGNGSCPS